MSHGNRDESYMIDGEYYSAEEVRKIFRCGQANFKDLDPRQRVAAEMVGQTNLNGRLLDVGCYAGTFLNALKGIYTNLDCYGVDSNTDNINIAHLLYPEWKDRFHKQNVYKLEYESGYFDCVTFLEVLEHLDRPVDAIRELNRIIRKGGYLVLSTPNGNSMGNILSTVKSGYVNKVAKILKRPHRLRARVFHENMDWSRHLVEYPPWSCHTILTLNGFELVEHQFIPSAKRRNFIEFLVPGLSGQQAILARKVNDAGTKII